ncbi:hypothetical protein GOBAR_DD36698 [Gossypium barbadense]|nr:hypothetical protein GOBAR_DD36698 [Gossypium barbadense]
MPLTMTPRLYFARGTPRYRAQPLTPLDVPGRTPPRAAHSLTSPPPQKIHMFFTKVKTELASSNPHQFITRKDLCRYDASSSPAITSRVKLPPDTPNLCGFSARFHRRFTSAWLNACGICPVEIQSLFGKINTVSMRSRRFVGVDSNDVKGWDLTKRDEPWKRRFGLTVQMAEPLSQVTSLVFI